MISGGMGPNIWHYLACI